MATTATAQEFVPSCDESSVPPCTLSDPLVLEDSSAVASTEQWHERRREEIPSLFEEHLFGRMPPRIAGQRVEVRSLDMKALGGAATRKESPVYSTGDDAGPSMDLLLYVPNDAAGPANAFLGLNFYSNHTIHADLGISVTSSWVPDREESHIGGNRATKASRGVRTNRWPVERTLERGYAPATAYNGDLDPDFDDEFKNGIHPLFYQEGQTQPAAEWGGNGAWAWGPSRAADCLETDLDIDRIAVMRRSGLGKTALLRRRYGETVARINGACPQWSSDSFDRFNDDEDALPFDQHRLIALSAPRPVNVPSTEDDRCPRGEVPASKPAGPVYGLLGTDGLPAHAMHAVGEAVAGTIGYHIRPGVRDVTDWDWERYIDFADRHLR